MKKILAFLPVLLVLALTLLNSCSGTAQETHTNTAAISTPYQDLDAAAFNKLRRENPEAVILDVRTPGEFAQGKIDGAVNLDIKDPAFSEQVSGLDKDKTYLVYCRTGRRSASACQLMQDQGFKNLYNLQGGILAWQAAGN